MQSKSWNFTLIFDINSWPVTSAFSTDEVLTGSLFLPPMVSTSACYLCSIIISWHVLQIKKHCNYSKTSSAAFKHFAEQPLLLLMYV